MSERPWNLSVLNAKRDCAPWFNTGATWPPIERLLWIITPRMVILVALSTEGRGGGRNNEKDIILVLKELVIGCDGVKIGCIDDEGNGSEGRTLDDASRDGGGRRRGAVEGSA